MVLSSSRSLLSRRFVTTTRHAMPIRWVTARHFACSSGDGILAPGLQKHPDWGAFLCVRSKMQVRVQSCGPPLVALYGAILPLRVPMSWVLYDFEISLVQFLLLVFSFTSCHAYLPSCLQSRECSLAFKRQFMPLSAGGLPMNAHHVTFRLSCLA